MMTALKQHEMIKYHLRLNDTSLAEIARELGVAQSSVTTASQGHRKSQRIQSKIAERLNTTVEQLWPEHYPTTAKEEPDAAIK